MSCLCKYVVCLILLQPPFSGTNFLGDLTSFILIVERMLGEFHPDIHSNYVSHIPLGIYFLRYLVVRNLQGDPILPFQFKSVVAAAERFLLR